MRPKSMALLMVALGCGLVASIGITHLMANRNVEPSGPVAETLPIFVAIKDIPLGECLSAAMLKQEPWPKDRVPQGACPTSKMWKGGASAKDYLPASQFWRTNYSLKAHPHKAPARSFP